MTNNTKQRRDLYEEITNAVIDSLTAGNIPWEKPWFAAATGPRSVSTGKLYRGGNALWLGLIQESKAYSSPWWLTFKQAKKMDGTVRKGEKASTAVYWMFLDEKKDGKKTGRQIPMLKHYSVFNIDQCDMPAEAIDRLASRLERLQGSHDGVQPAADTDAYHNGMQIVDAYRTDQGIPLTCDYTQQAYYRPGTDTINMPDHDSFKTDEHYLHTYLHEAMHSTGHSSRLARGVDTKQAAFGSEDYSREELVAELGASFAAGMLGTDVPAVNTNRDAYIKSWIKSLKNDPKAIIWAAGRASKAADMVLALDAEAGEAEPALEYTKK